MMLVPYDDNDDVDVDSEQSCDTVETIAVGEVTSAT